METLTSCIIEIKYEYNEDNEIRYTTVKPSKLMDFCNKWITNTKLTKHGTTNGNTKNNLNNKLIAQHNHHHTGNTIQIIESPELLK
jgi:hypothetical protein